MLPIQLQGGAFVGLLARRRKWHQAEYNRILASRDLLPSEQAREALAQHRACIWEIDAIMAKEEPAWGPEREITEKFLNWNGEGVA